MKTKEEYISQINKTGSVTMHIHPEHLGRIKKMKTVGELTSDELNDKQREIRLIKKKVDFLAEEIVSAIYDSFDDVMKYLDKETAGSKINIDEGTVTFLSKKEVVRNKGREAMERMGLPDFLKKSMMDRLDDMSEGEVDGLIK